MSVTDLIIGGLTPFTTIDFPDNLAAVVFCQGCPWHCGYCHNPPLLDFKTSTTLTWEQVDTFLCRRRGLLDAVVFSGGEPTVQPGLLDALLRVKELGFKIGLHTAGIDCRRFSDLLPQLDWVGFDVKSSFEDYSKITGIANSGKRPLQSLELLIQSGIHYECRTTLHPFLSESRLISLAQQLASLGVQQYVLQTCRTKTCLDSSLQTGFLENTLLKNEIFLQHIRQFIPKTTVRVY